MDYINDVFVQDIHNGPYCLYSIYIVGSLVKGATPFKVADTSLYNGSRIFKNSYPQFHFTFHSLRKILFFRNCLD